jgi:arylsulfatase
MFQSDNGAEGWPVDGGADPRATDEANAVEPAYSQLGTDNGKQAAQRLQYGLRWAEVSAAPFRMTKGYMAEGGVSTPLIVRLPGQNASGGTRRALTHVTDNTATFLALAGVTPPSAPAPAAVDAATGIDRNKGKVLYQDRAVYPVTGKSLLGYLDGNGAGQVRTDPLGEESYGRAFLFSGDGKWKLLWTEPPAGPLDGHWELFDVTRDRGETTDVSGANPAVVEQLTRQWDQYMARVGGVEPRKPQGYY